MRVDIVVRLNFHLSCWRSAGRVVETQGGSGSDLSDC